MLFFLIVLLLLIATGALWLVVKVAVGVALGLLLAVAVIAGFVWWRIRRALRGSGNDWRQVQGGGKGSSQVTVHYREPKD